MYNPSADFTSLKITVLSLCIILFGVAVIVEKVIASKTVQRLAKINNINELSKRELRIVKKCAFSKEKVLNKLNKRSRISIKSGKVIVAFGWILFCVDILRRFLGFMIFIINNQKGTFLITSDYFYPIFFISWIVLMNLFLKNVSKFFSAYSDLYSRIL